MDSLKHMFDLARRFADENEDELQYLNLVYCGNDLWVASFDHEAAKNEVCENLFDYWIEHVDELKFTADGPTPELAIANAIAKSKLNLPAEREKSRVFNAAIARLARANAPVEEWAEVIE